MVQINFAQKTVNVKIVYYGPGMSGKTTNLEVVHQRSPEANHGDLTSISTDGDRTLFFDYMPLELGTVAGMRTCFQLYTVPGQVYYNSTRKLVLQGVDGVIFIADSGRGMLEQNLESLRNLEENLNEYGKSLATMPHVLQWNKRDLPDAMSSDELTKHLNHHGCESFEAVANSGQGVFPTLKALAACVLKDIMKETAAGGAQGKAPAMAGGQGSSAPKAVTPAPAQAAPGGSMAPGQGHLSSPSPAMPSVAMPAPVATPPQFAGAEAAQLGLQSSPQAAHGQPAGMPATRQPIAQVAAPQAPAPTASPASMMQVAGPQAAPQQAPVRTRKPATPQGTAVRRARRAPASAPAAKPSKKGLPTGVFVVLAAGVGAAIAWAALTFLV